MDVELNHLLVTLNADSVDSITESKFPANNFCNLSRNTVEADNGSWTATYLNGKQSYLELFARDEAGELRESFSGIAFNTQRIGQIYEIEARLEKLLPGRVRREMRILKTDAGKVPWFCYVYIVDSEATGLYSWLMEFHQDYLESKDIRLSESGLLDRSTLLTSKIGHDSYTSLFDDIVEVDLELTSQEHNNLKILLCAFGCESSQTGKVTHYCSNGFVLNVSETSTPIYRIRKATCSFTEDSEVEEELRFGDSVMLSMNKDSAYWQFGPGNTSRG
ncbi:MAG: DUF5829 family protein [Planctomycetota bacterium]|jgi:hypothetical protein